MARNLKCLFLDSCSDFDRAMWTNIIFNSCHVCEMPTGKDQAKLILLLTAPIRAQGIYFDHSACLTFCLHSFLSSGGICWDFYEDGDDVSSHIEAYMSAASILERLARLELNRNNSTKVDTLQILATLFCKFHHERGLFLFWSSGTRN